jgi:alanyl-tRNA synthetase
MTDRLYYNDPYLRAFDATIERVDRGDERFVVTLDRTAFYPSSGGQPFDTGALLIAGRDVRIAEPAADVDQPSLRVVDVIDEEDGSIAHVVEPRTNLEPGLLKLEPGMSVHGVIDWARRFDHMQQHSGQHVLSAAFDRLFGVRTASFHLGAAASTIDLAREVSSADIAAAEAEANRIVWEDRPVAIRFATAEEAARLPLRKEPVRGGTLRLIDVEGFDLSACGGTHVARTGGIGVIAIAASERFKGGQRIEFVCGARALSAFRSLRDTVSGSVRLLSVLPMELPASIERLQADAKDQKRSLVALQGELARYRAEELAASAEATAAGKLVAREVDADANGLKALATAIAARAGYVVVLVSSSTPALAVVARSADMSLSAQQLLASLTAQFGGRGGGKPEFAQGGGLAASPDAILKAARDAM